MFLLFVVPANAQQRTVPLVLIQPAGIKAKYDSPPNYGVIYGAIAAWAEEYTNKRGTAQIGAFHGATSGVDWNSVAATELACIGAAAGESCGEPLRFEGDEKSLLQTLQASGKSRAFVLTLVQLYDGTAYRARATVRDVDARQNALKNLRVFTAIYETFPPPDVLEVGKKRPAALWSYWDDKSPGAKLTLEGRASVKELASMLTVLEQAIPLDHPTSAIGWQDLKSIKSAEAGGRAVCRGICSGTLVLKDDGARMWITTDGGRGEYGRTVVSLDPNAAMINSNISAYLIQPMLDWKWAVLPQVQD